MRKIPLFLKIAFVLIIFSLNLNAQELKKDMVKEDSSSLFLCLGGGYFLPQDDIAKSLNPAWSANFLFQYNNIANSVAGIGLDILYSYLPDKKNSSGIRYIVPIPHLTFTFTPYNIFELQIKGGGGPGILSYDIETDDGTDKRNIVDFTTIFGVTVMKTFLRRYIIGISGSYYFFFERNGSGAVNMNLFAGYKF